MAQSYRGWVGRDRALVLPNISARFWCSAVTRVSSFGSSGGLKGSQPCGWAEQRQGVRDNAWGGYGSSWPINLQIMSGFTQSLTSQIIVWVNVAGGDTMIRRATVKAVFFQQLSLTFFEWGKFFMSVPSPALNKKHYLRKIFDENGAQNMYSSYWQFQFYQWHLLVIYFTSALEGNYTNEQQVKLETYRLSDSSPAANSSLIESESPRKNISCKWSSTVASWMLY